MRSGLIHVEFPCQVSIHPKDPAPCDSTSAKRSSCLWWLTSTGAKKTFNKLTELMTHTATGIQTVAVAAATVVAYNGVSKSHCAPAGAYAVR